MLQASGYGLWVAVIATGLGLLTGSPATAAGTPAVGWPQALSEPAGLRSEVRAEARIRLIYRGLASWGSDAALRRRALALPTARLRQLESPSHDRWVAAERLFRRRGALRSVRYGLGFDYLIGRAMALHLDLHQRRKSKRAGVRIRVSGADRVAVEYHRRLSFGMALDPVRTEDGERLLRWVPQLRVNLDDQVGRRCRGVVEYGYWRGGDKYVTSAEQVLQASLKMRF